MIAEKKYSRSFFTLLELLVVIAIISVLASITLPVLAKARRAAWQTSCANNLRQIGIGARAYGDSFDGYAPPAEMPRGYGNFLNYVYVDELSRTKGVFLCPSVPEDGAFNPYGGIGHYGELSAASYLMNVIRDKGVDGWSCDSTDISTPHASSYGWCGDSAMIPIRFNQVTHPESKIFIVDSAAGLTNPSIARGIFRLTETDHGEPIDYDREQILSDERQVNDKHKGGFNALFGDVHVELRSKTKADEWNVVNTD